MVTRVEGQLMSRPRRPPHCMLHEKTLETSHAFHTLRSPTEEDKGACAVLAQALADGSEEAEGVLEVWVIMTTKHEVDTKMIGLYDYAEEEEEARVYVLNINASRNW